MIKRALFFMVFSLATISAVCVGSVKENTVLLPKPQKIQYKNGYFMLDNVSIKSNVLEEEIKQYVKDHKGIVSSTSRKQIVVNIVRDFKPCTVNKSEAYSLQVSNTQIKIEAYTVKGAYWALMTLKQLTTKTSNKKAKVRKCEVLDYPAFRIRGFMHDVGRSFISIPELKRQIDILSQYKINVFHWHLTENQAWRLESKLFPMLNDSVNMTRLKGKYYTLEEAKELVAYCKSRNMLLIPEIDMPGHSAAFVRTFRHDMQSTEGMKILKLLIDEVCNTFDVPYLHIGTDEVKFTNPTFVSEMVSYIRAKGKKVISWNPGWNYKVGEVDMTQLWSYRGKAQKGISAIDSRFHYINHFDTFADLIALYNSKIYNQTKGSDDVAGVIVGIWNDRLLNDQQSIMVENGFYPNMLAIAERAWCGGGSEYFDKNGTMLPTDRNDKLFKDFADFERRLLYHKDKNFKGFPFKYVKQTNIEWAITDQFPNDGDLHKSFPPEKEISDSYEYNGIRYLTNRAIGAGIYLRHVWGKLVPSFYKEPKENHTAYAYTYVYSPTKQKVGLMAEFQNYSRSESDIPPSQGKWDYKESRIWVNDQEILPPIWTSTHTTRSNEVTLGNENCVSRPPIAVILNKGWNKVLLKLPVGKFTTDEIRLVKWHFTAVFTTLDGEKAIEDLIYSPDKKLKH